MERMYKTPKNYAFVKWKSVDDCLFVFCAREGSERDLMIGLTLHRGQ